MNKEQRNILIVEDEFINAEFVEQVVIQLGHKVIGNVKNANDAITIVSNNWIDFVFMDINLEGNIDGILCAKLLNKQKDIAIIYMTALTDKDIVSDTMDTNIYGYLAKPFDAYDIETTLAIAIKRNIDPSLNNTTIDEAEMIKLGNNYSYTIATKTLLINNIPTHLTVNETNILHILCLNINQNISYEALQKYVWNNKSISVSTIRDTVLRLRKKTPYLALDNIAGIGYCLKNV